MAIKALEGFDKKEHEYGFNYIRRETMKKCVYYRCTKCGRPEKMMAAGAVKYVLDHLLCPCGARRFTFISKQQYDDMTQKRNVITKGGVTKFKAPKDKTNKNKPKSVINTKPTYLDQLRNVSSVTEEHEEAKTKEERDGKRKKKKKRKNSDS